MVFPVVAATVPATEVDDAGGCGGAVQDRCPLGVAAVAPVSQPAGQRCGAARRTDGRLWWLGRRHGWWRCSRLWCCRLRPQAAVAVVVAVAAAAGLNVCRIVWNFLPRTLESSISHSFPCTVRHCVRASYTWFVCASSHIQGLCQLIRPVTSCPVVEASVDLPHASHGAR